MNTLKREKRQMAFKYWYTPSTYKYLINDLQSVSGRLYMLNTDQPLKLTHKLSKGWHTISLFAPSRKKAEHYFKKITHHKVKFSILDKH
jgi:hypothetical protein